MSYFKIRRMKLNHPDYKLIVRHSPLMHLAMVADESTGICDTTITQLAEMCSLSPQRMRTLMDKYVLDGILIKETKRSFKVGGTHPINRSTVKVNFNHVLWKDFGIDASAGDSFDKPFRGYPKEYNEDWKIYCGNDKKRVGSKYTAWRKWDGAVKRYGRAKVMKGTTAYIAECEAMNKWKKNASTFWYYRSGNPHYLEDKYQKDPNAYVALSKLMDSPMLGNILNGGLKITITGDKYMCETLLALKGSNRSLSDVLDREGETKFKDKFVDLYEMISHERTDVDGLALNIYSNSDQEIEWRVDYG